MDLHYTSLLDVSKSIKSGAVSPVEVTEAILKRIEAHDGSLKSYTTVLPERAMSQAKKAEAEIAAGFWRGPLHGVPIAVKDLCDTTYAPTAAGMYIHKNRMANSNATAVERLEMAGAIMLGKLTMTEGAFGAHHPKMPTPRNPWNTDYWTGASSSGSGAATAAGFCYASLGSDTGGSIRFPTGACGLSGMKPTWGRISRAGVCDLSESLDHLGPMTRTVADTAAVLGVIAGADPNDPTAAKVPVPDYLSGLSGGIRGLKIGLDETWVYGGTDPEVAGVLKEAIDILIALGATIVPVKFPDTTGMAQAWTDLCAVETAIAHEATYPSRKDEYGPELAGFIETGRKVDAFSLGKAQIFRNEFKGSLAALFEIVDVLICPMMPYKIPTLAGWDEVMKGDFGDYLKFTGVFNFTGSPSVIMQGGFDSRGIPIGFQLIGRPFEEALLLKAGHTFQTVTDWHTKNPVL
ncbi:amidase [Chthonobacter albigriseus]|uniref:amidase n=1 Tax=Chthonobacter albigriseus TaxID=1683161 RepID=UPI0015EF840D|nr:amidase [Chthonobacter albigriseus]